MRICKYIIPTVTLKEKIVCRISILIRQIILKAHKKMLGNKFQVSRVGQCQIQRELPYQ